MNEFFLKSYTLIILLFHGFKYIDFSTFLILYVSGYLIKLFILSIINFYNKRLSFTLKLSDLNYSELFKFGLYVFAGGLSRLINDEKVEHILADFKVVTGESAFVVRTFFFIIFGWSVSVGSMFNLKSIAIGIALLIIIYVVRAICLFIFSGKNIFPQIFLAPRGLITILLFFAIPKELTDKYDFNGVLLFIILASCLIMTWSLIRHKKNLERFDNEDLLDDSEEDEVLIEETDLEELD